MPKWWTSNTSKSIPMSTTNDPTISSNKKKTRSLVSFFVDKQKNDSIYPIHPSIDVDLSRQKQDPTLNYYREQSIIPKQWRTTQSIPSTIYNDPQIQFKNHSYGYLQLLDELINENNSCFGFSLSNITSKYCLYMTIIIFLGICLIISLPAVLKK
jgi:hypothetical protein